MSRLLFELHFILLYSKDVASNLIWWEDFKLGEAAELGKHTFTEREIVAVARQFDPLAFHIDPATAKKTVFGGLIAPSWHTCAVGMWMLCEMLVKHTVSLGSPGIDLFGRKP
jgi:acyl dehydratase